MDANNAWFSAGGWWSRGDFAPGGVTPPGTLASFFTAAGYSTVVNKADVTGNRPSISAGLIASANTHRASGHYVVMLLDDDVMYKSNQGDEVSMWPTHWVTLTTPVTDGGLLAYYDPISMSVFSWGKIHPIPEFATSPLKKWYFLNKFYGFVAAKL